MELQACPDEDVAKRSRRGPDIVRQRLDRRRTQWAGKDVSQAEGKLEGELAQAVILGKEWQMSDMPAGALRESCISSPGSALGAGTRADSTTTT